MKDELTLATRKVITERAHYFILFTNLATKVVAMYIHYYLQPSALGICYTLASKVLAIITDSANAIVGRNYNWHLFEVICYVNSEQK